MERLRFDVQKQGLGRRSLGGEPLVYHCNFYNYWLQKTVLLVDDLGMDEVIQDAAAASVYACLRGLGGNDASLAEALFAELGFGQIDLSAITAEGGSATTSVSHYGQCLGAAAGVSFAKPQSRFDAGYAAALGKALVIMHGSDHQHALKEIDGAALAVAETSTQVAAILNYVISGKL